MHRLTPDERREVEAAFESVFSRMPPERFDALAEQYQAEEEEHIAEVNSFMDGLFRRSASKGEENGPSDGKTQEEDSEV